MMDKPRYNRISIVLDELGIDQKDLAKLVGVTKDTVSRWCRNENHPRLPDLHKIARMLRIDIRRLIEPTSWENETSPSPLAELKLKKEKENADKTRHPSRTKLFRKKNRPYATSTTLPIYS